MNRPSARWVVVLAAFLAVTLTAAAAATASAATRHRPQPRRQTLSARDRVLVHRAGSLALAGLRAASTGANKHVVPPKKKPKKKKKKPAPPATPTPPPPPAPVPNIPAPPTAISVDTAHPGATISPALFGSDFLAPDGGMGAWDGAPLDNAGGFDPSFLSDVQGPVYTGSLRFPGGITAQAYDWTRAVGAQSDRTDNPLSPTAGPGTSQVGPDEFSQLLSDTGATGVMTVNFGTGTAAQAAALVTHMGNADIPYWEVGNEENTINGWRTAGTLAADGPSSCVSDSEAAGDAAKSAVAMCAYIYGGTGTYSNQLAVTATDRRTSMPVAGTSNGTAGQAFQVQFPPIMPGSLTVKMRAGSTTTTIDPSNYQENDATGAITFLNSGVPPSGDTIVASYSSHHDGFSGPDGFYTKMKQANASIQVCATDPNPDFVTAMGSTADPGGEPYDCLQDHPYVGAGDISPATPIADYESQVMAVPDVTEVNAVQALQAEVDAAAGHHVPLVLTEYGQLIDSTPDPLDAPYYLNSLDEALINASQLANWIGLGIPVADRQLLTAELPAATAVTSGLPGAAPFAVTGAITTPGPTTVVQPTGLYLGLMKPLAGGALLPSTVAGNPVLTTSGASAVGDLSVVSAATSSGPSVVVAVINRSPTADVPASVAFSGVPGSGAATVTTLDGPSPLSDNTAAAPTTVTTSTSTAAVTAGSTVVTFPAHSISLVTLPGA
jgi:alpha-L-arabinofuranosidase